MFMVNTIVHLKAPLDERFQGAGPMEDIRAEKYSCYGRLEENIYQVRVTVVEEPLIDVHERI